MPNYNAMHPSPSAPECVPRRQRVYWGAGLLPPLLLAWLALSGTSAWEVGLVAAGVSAFVGALLAPGDPFPWRPWRLLPFCVFFLHQSVRGGLDVAGRALHWRMPVEPCFVDYALSLPPGQPRTLMISLVSLVPGSLSVDLDVERNVLRVHLLVPEGEAAVRELEARIADLFALAAPQTR